MKRGVWIIVVLLAVFLVAELFVRHSLTRRGDRPTFVVLPHSTALLPEEAGASAPPAPGLEGMTADDVVRGLIFLVEQEGATRLTPEQARELLPVARRLRADRHRLLTLRQGRHEANEAAMEDTLALARILSNAELAEVIQRRTPSPKDGGDADWNALLKWLEDAN